MIIKTSITTFSGKTIDFTDLNSSQIDIEDIAHALSLICRFNGHGKFFYPVSQHCIEVARLVSDRDKETRLAALLHDAAEAYIGDLSTGMKGTINIDGKSKYKEISDKLESIIFKKFNIVTWEQSSIKFADKIALNTEAKSLFSKCDWIDDALVSKYEVKFISPDIAKLTFLAEFAKIVASE